MAAAGGFSCLLGRGRVLLWLERTPGALRWPPTGRTFPGNVPVLYVGLEKVDAPDEEKGLGLLGTGGGATIWDEPLPKN